MKKFFCRVFAMRRFPLPASDKRACRTVVGECGPTSRKRDSSESAYTKNKRKIPFAIAHDIFLENNSFFAGYSRCEDSRSLRLTSELVELRSGNVDLHLAGEIALNQLTLKTKGKYHSLSLTIFSFCWQG